MSFVEVLAEIPQLSAAQRRELLQRVLVADDAANDGRAKSLRAERVGGRLVLVGPRVIRQAEVETILDEELIGVPPELVSA